MQIGLLTNIQINKFQWGRFHGEFAWCITLNLKNWRKRNQVLGVFLLLAVGDLQVFLFEDDFSSFFRCQNVRQVRQ
jgi:hypothetical protein